jgi:hypothetical protein
MWVRFWDRCDVDSYIDLERCIVMGSMRVAGIYERAGLRCAGYEPHPLHDNASLYTKKIIRIVYPFPIAKTLVRSEERAAQAECKGA